MGDLISKKVLLKALSRMSTEHFDMLKHEYDWKNWKECLDDIFEVIHSQSVAYDKERVKQELTDKAERHGGEDYYIELGDALEIVERGGVDG